MNSDNSEVLTIFRQIILITGIPCLFFILPYLFISFMQPETFVYVLGGSVSVGVLIALYMVLNNIVKAWDSIKELRKGK
jgi:hypothetical protein